MLPAIAAFAAGALSGAMSYSKFSFWGLLLLMGLLLVFVFW